VIESRSSARAAARRLESRTPTTGQMRQPARVREKCERLADRRFRSAAPRSRSIRSGDWRRSGAVVAMKILVEQ
jgi:hypothetical protein